MVALALLRSGERSQAGLGLGFKSDMENMRSLKRERGIERDKCSSLEEQKDGSSIPVSLRLQSLASTCKCQTSHLSIGVRWTQTSAYLSM